MDMLVCMFIYVIFCWVCIGLVSSNAVNLKWTEGKFGAAIGMTTILLIYGGMFVFMIIFPDGF